MNGILNFQWHIENKIATGSKPDRENKLNELIQMGFGTIISLEPIGKSIEDLIYRLDIQYHQIRIEETDESSRFDPTEIPNQTWEKFCECINTGLKSKKPIYIHCSAGITRSVRLTKRYIDEILAK